MSKLKNFKKLLGFLLCLIALCIAVAIGGGNTLSSSASAENKNIKKSQDYLYHGYDMGNFQAFCNYLNSLGYELDDILNFTVEDYLQVYWEAMDLGIITPLENDYLLAKIPKIEPLWGGTNAKDYEKYTASTHQFIADKAYEYVQSDYENLFIPIPSNKQVNTSNGSGSDWANLVWYANWPDLVEDDSWGVPTNASHFYYPDNGGNLFILGGEAFIHLGGLNARDRFVGHYNDAVDYFNGTNGKIQSKSESFKSLGKALHYISDMATPVHTGYQCLTVGDAGIMGLYPHLPFEEDAYNKQSNYTYNINPAGWDIDINTFAYNIAVTSNALYTYNISTLKSRAEQALRNAVNACASVLVRFADEVGHKRNGLIILDNVVTGHNSILNNQGSVTIPDGVSTIAGNSLASAQLSQISIPASVTHIGIGAFSPTTELASFSGNRSNTSNIRYINKQFRFC